MTAKMSDRGDNLTEANLQAEGLREEPAQRAADRWEMEEEDSSPHNLPTWSPVQRLPTGHLNTNYCLSIQVILTDELGEVPPPLHSWTTPVIEDMLRERLELDSQKQLLLVQVGQYSFMGDILWERVSRQTRLGMPHFS